jgi:hypothetical protein
VVENLPQVLQQITHKDGDQTKPLGMEKGPSCRLKANLRFTLLNIKMARLLPSNALNSAMDLNFDTFFLMISSQGEKLSI